MDEIATLRLFMVDQDPDERFKIEGDPEDALRGLLASEADPQKIAATLERVRTAQPADLAIPEHRDALITDARMAGATMDQINEALNTPR